MTKTYLAFPSPALHAVQAQPILLGSLPRLSGCSRQRLKPIRVAFQESRPALLGAEL